MFEFPLLRFDDRIWLEELQNGKFYMRNSFYYQKKEIDDLARSDPFDGSIPFSDVNGVMKAISGKKTTNERLVILDRSIKCFYHCTPDDFVITDGGLWKLAFSEATINMVKEFKAESAILIFSPSAMKNKLKIYVIRKKKTYGAAMYSILMIPGILKQFYLCLRMLVRVISCHFISIINFRAKKNLGFVYNIHLM